MRVFLRVVAVLEMLGALLVFVVSITLLKPLGAGAVALLSVPFSVLMGYAGVQLWRLKNRGRVLSAGLLGLFLIFNVGLLVTRGFSGTVFVRTLLDVAVLVGLLSRGAVEVCAAIDRVQ